MKVKLINTMAGPDGVFLSGSVVDFDQKTAMDLVRGGYAVAIDEQEPESKEEQVVSEPVIETAAKTAKPKKGR